MKKSNNAKKIERKEKRSKYLTYKFILKKAKLDDQVVERLEKLTRVSKDLFNRANYLVKQEYNKTGKWLRYQDFYDMLKHAREIKKGSHFALLKAQTIQQVLLHVDRSWSAYFNGLKEWKKAPEWKKRTKLIPKPKQPYFKKKDGHFLLIFTYQNIQIENDKVLLKMTYTFRKKFPHLKDPVIISIPNLKERNFNNKNFQQVRILPRDTFYQVEIVYERPPVPNHGLDATRFIAIDMGVNNLITAVENRCRKPFIISGRFIKAYNQYYNKLKAEYQSKIMKQGIPWDQVLDEQGKKNVKDLAASMGRNWKKLLKSLKYDEKQPFIAMRGNEWLRGLDESTIAKLETLLNRKRKVCSKTLTRLTTKRTAWLTDVFHKISHAFIEYCVKEKIGNIVLPQLKQIKTRINNGKRNNQSFHYIPIARLRAMLSYKAEYQGIRVWDEVSESYTSKTSALDKEPIKKRKTYVGRRIKRGLFKCSEQIRKVHGSSNLVNADVNGGLNILRKVIGDAFLNDVVDSGCWLHPVRIKTVGSLRQLLPDDLTHGRESDKKLVHATICRVIA
ncbi:MAG: RNA-guided endonuclease InsQ/TnpB family protein [Promethearchaeota archaeon]